MPPVVAATRKRYVDLDRQALELRLAEAEAKIHELLPAHERFALEARVPEHEERVRPFLDKVFGGADKYEVECRETTCHIAPAEGANEDWVAVVQQSPDRFELFDGLMFSGNEMWADVLEPGSGTSRKLMMKAASAIHAAESVNRCRTQHRSPESIDLQLALDVVNRKLVVDLRKQTVPVELGACLVRAAQAVVDTIAIPTDAAAVDPISVGV